MDWIVLLAALLAAIPVGWAWAWEQAQRRREWEQATLADIRHTYADLPQWISVSYRPAPDDDPDPEPDPADTRPLGPLPDDVTRTLGQQEA